MSLIYTEDTNFQLHASKNWKIGIYDDTLVTIGTKVTVLFAAKVYLNF